MNNLALDDELVQEYLAESREHLATIESDLLSIEQAGAAIDEQLVNRVFRAAHSIKGGAGFFDLDKIRELGHKTENVLDLIRSRQLVPSPEVVNVLLLAFDRLSNLIDNHSVSNQADITQFVEALTTLSEGNIPASAPISDKNEAMQLDQVTNSPGPKSAVAGHAEGTSQKSVPEQKPLAEGVETPKQSGEPGVVQHEATIRLNVSLLDSLMTLAGEMVLSRNQLHEALATGNQRAIATSANRISAVTSELQEAVTLTRMQPVSSVFGKFPRLVRDLSKELGKEITLQLEGGEVEIDKTILEGLSDPLTHMVRNAVDHGIETPQVRTSQGKRASGCLTLRASHQAGQVVIEISDDGKGLPADKIAASTIAKGLITAEQVQSMTEREKMALIFLPGVSTAEKISSISGRGVGMDVVKTNLDKLGGKVEIDSVLGQGSCFRIKLPLTLAIIPSLIISESGRRFALPQLRVGELIRVSTSQVCERIDRAGKAEVLNLRDRLIPLLHLADVIGVPRVDREAHAMHIVMVDTGAFEFGLVVDKLHDTVEIVVKPLGRHLKDLRDYAGATILGDGEVALILDAAGLAERGGMRHDAAAAPAVLNGTGEVAADVHSLLLFHNAPNEQCAVPIELVKRIEQLLPHQVEYIGGKRSMQYQGRSLPLVMLQDIANVSALDPAQEWVMILIEGGARSLGLVAAKPLDMLEAAIKLDTVTLRQPGIAGSAILSGRTTMILDILELAASVVVGEEASLVSRMSSSPIEAGSTVLIAEDSDFFRDQIKRLVESVGYRAMVANDGQAAWEMLGKHAGEISLVATDVEMPRMDGLSLTRKIRSDSRFSRLPVIALSSLAGEEEIARGMEAGVNEYQVKLDREMLVEGIRRSLAAVA